MVSKDEEDEEDSEEGDKATEPESKRKVCLLCSVGLDLC